VLLLWTASFLTDGLNSETQYSPVPPTPQQAIDQGNGRLFSAVKPLHSVREFRPTQGVSFWHGLFVLRGL